MGVVGGFDVDCSCRCVGLSGCVGFALFVWFCCVIVLYGFLRLFLSCFEFCVFMVAFVCVWLCGRCLMRSGVVVFCMRRFAVYWRNLSVSRVSSVGVLCVCQVNSCGLGW